MDERRTSKREPLELKIEYKRLNHFIFDYTQNISEGGLFLCTDDPLEPGTDATFLLHIPRERDPVVIPGTVRWVVRPEHASTEKPAGMGIRFRWTQDEARKIVERVRAIAERAFGPAVASEIGRTRLRGTT